MKYFIEVWLRGYAKDKIREISLKDSESFHPHVTLVRPFDLLVSEDKIKSIVIEFCKGKDPIQFNLKGKGNFGEIFYIPVVDAEELLEFSNGLEKVLEGNVQFVEKHGDSKILHATVGSDFSYCEKIKQHMLRLTMIRDKKIWFSYDFVTQQELSRKESLDKLKWYETVNNFFKKTM